MLGPGEIYKVSNVTDNSRRLCEDKGFFCHFRRVRRCEQVPGVVLPVRLCDGSCNVARSPTAGDSGECSCKQACLR